MFTQPFSMSCPFFPGYFASATPAPVDVFLSTRSPNPVIQRRVTHKVVFTPPLSLIYKISFLKRFVYLSCFLKMNNLPEKKVSTFTGCLSGFECKTVIMTL